jgi:hypothetical protein
LFSHVRQGEEIIFHLFVCDWFVIHAVPIKILNRAHLFMQLGCQL